MFKRPGLVFVLVTVCGGLVGMAFLVYRLFGASAPASTTTAQPAALVAVITGTPEPTATETPRPTPTDDPQVVARVTEQYLAQRDADIAAQNADTANKNLANEEKRGQLLALYDWTPTAAAQATQNAQATVIVQSTADAQARNTANKLLADKSEIDVAREKANIQARFYGQVGVGAFVLILAIIIAYNANDAIMVRRRKTILTETNLSGDDIIENLGETHPADAPHFAPVAPGLYHPTNVPVADKVFRVWAEKMLEGETAGINKWETAESPFGRVGYSAFLEWAEGRGYIDETGKGKVLSDSGRNFCAGWLARHQLTPSPFRHQTPESA